MSRLRMAVIGVGHLGKEHARILAGHARRGAGGRGRRQRRPGPGGGPALRDPGPIGDYWPLLNLVDAAVIVVPTTHHHAVASEFLRRGIPAPGRKTAGLEPGTGRRPGRAGPAPRRGACRSATSSASTRLLRSWKAIRCSPSSSHCERLGPFSGRSTDIGVVLDLMIHDLDLLLALVTCPVQLGGGPGRDGVRPPRGRGQRPAELRQRLRGRSSPPAGPARDPVRRMHVWAPEGYAGLDFARRCLTSGPAFGAATPPRPGRADTCDAAELGHAQE